MTAIMSDDPQGWHPPSGSGWQPPQPPQQPPPPPQQQPPPIAGGWGAPPPQQAWGWGAPLPPENKPGIIPLRPLAVGEVLDGVFSTIRRYPRLVLGMAAVVAAFQAVLSVLIPGLLGAFSFSFDPGAAESVDASLQVFQLISQGLGYVVSAVLGALLAGAMIVIVGEAVLGRPVTGRAVWDRVRPRFWPLIGCSLIVGIVPAIGLVFCIAPGAWLWAAWALATPALILEGLGPIQSIRRSFRLVKGAWWRTFFIRLLATLISGVVAGVIAIPFAAVGALISGFSAFDGTSGPPISFIALYALGTALAATITLPLGAGVQGLLYVDRRIRAEALDVRLAEAAAASAG
jgi:hypothetical protein